VAPDEAMHVGDHLIADVEGARAVGITPVFIDRRAALRFQTAPHPELAPGTYVVSSLAELFDILEGM